MFHTSYEYIYHREMCKKLISRINNQTSVQVAWNTTKPWISWIDSSSLNLQASKLKCLNRRRRRVDWWTTKLFQNCVDWTKNEFHSLWMPLLGWYPDWCLGNEEDKNEETSNGDAYSSKQFENYLKSNFCLS